MRKIPCRALFFFSVLFTLSIQTQALQCRALLTENYFTTARRQLKDVTQLKIIAYNVENLLQTVGKYIRVSGNKYERRPELDSYQKSPQDIIRIQEILRSELPDLAILSEIENRAAVDVLLSPPSLKNKYNIFLIEGNDPRGIDVAMIVRSDLPFIAEYQTHKNVTWFDPVEQQTAPLFSRDLPALLLRKNENQDPFLIILGNHAKSKRDRPGDPESFTLRSAQYAKAAEIVKDYQRHFPRAQIILGGDFNTDVRTANELAPLRQVLESSFGVAKSAPVESDRITHSYFTLEGEARYSQMDDLMISQGLQSNVLSARIIHYTKSNGQIMPLPRSYKERKKQPSDHYPVEMILSTKGLF